MLLDRVHDVLRIGGAVLRDALCTVSTKIASYTQNEFPTNNGRIIDSFFTQMINIAC